MKTIKFNVCVVLLMLLGLGFFTSCNDAEGVDNREQEYGYAQFKLYKRASYGDAVEPKASTRAIKQELDFLAETAQKLDGVYGARMTGGGFGGCTVNLMEQSAVENFVKSIQTAYQSRFGVIPAIYPVTICDGAGVKHDDI